MKIFDPDVLRNNAQRLRREELARIAHLVEIKWSTLWKSSHAPHPCQVPAPPDA